MSKSTKSFKAEVQEVLDLVINSLYSNKEIFLRELISNASDAIDRLRFESLSNKKLSLNNPKIFITADKDKKTLTISDNGIGMLQEEVEDNIGRIAKSGTKAFMKELKEKGKSLDSNMIGQFGVGFYSAFMVAKKIILHTLKAGETPDKAVTWTSTGQGKYTIEAGTKKELGTEIILELKDEYLEFLEEFKIKEIVSRYSNYLNYPIKMDVSRQEKPKDEKGEEIADAQPETIVETQTLNSEQALWERQKNKIKPEEYNEFYKHISHDWSNPLEIIHYNVEGTIEFKALLFIPEKAPFDMFNQQNKAGIHLYVKKVFIMDDCQKIVPEYLRFIKGVIDTNDLPLNVSREILQEDKMLIKISKSVVSKILDTLKNLKEKDEDKYLNFYKVFGKVLKEGVYSDFANKEKLQDLLLFESTMVEEGKFTDLSTYVSRMPEEQKEIYFITGYDKQAIKNSPYLELFKKKSFEVLYFTDPVDEWLAQSLTEYKGKKLRSILKGEIDIDENTKKQTEQEKTVLEDIRKILDKQLQEVRFSNRLTDFPCCLVADENAMSANMERIYRAMSQNIPPTKRILELNQKHPLIKHLISIAKKEKEKENLKELVELLYQKALLIEGSPLENPNNFARRITELMLSKING